MKIQNILPREAAFVESFIEEDVVSLKIKIKNYKVVVYSKKEVIQKLKASCEKFVDDFTVTEDCRKIFLLVKKKTKLDIDKRKFGKFIKKYTTNIKGFKVVNYNYKLGDMDIYVNATLNTVHFLNSSKKYWISVENDVTFLLLIFRTALLRSLNDAYHKDGYSIIHGILVGKNNKHHLITGDSGSGKSTLSLLLALRGWTSFSEDTVLLRLNKKLEFLEMPFFFTLKSLLTEEINIEPNLLDSHLIEVECSLLRYLLPGAIISNNKKILKDLKLTSVIHLMKSTRTSVKRTYDTKKIEKSFEFSKDPTVYTFDKDLFKKMFNYMEENVKFYEFRRGNNLTKMVEIFESNFS